MRMPSSSKAWKSWPASPFSRQAQAADPRTALILLERGILDAFGVLASRLVVLPAYVNVGRSLIWPMIMLSGATQD